MENTWYSRTEILIGKENMQKLNSFKIVVIGLGGVGGSCVEALCRAGIGNIMIIDNDKIDVTNINRQLISNQSNIGSLKTKEIHNRLKLINPNINIISKNIFCLPGKIDFIFEYKPHYIIDAIDTITTKIYLAKKTTEFKLNFISCMGMGNKLDPSLIRYGKISDTKGSGCVVSKIIRKELKKINISNIDVVFSLEKAKKVISSSANGRHSPGSISYVPPVAGYFLTAKVVNNLIL